MSTDRVSITTPGGTRIEINSVDGADTVETQERPAATRPVQGQRVEELQSRIHQMQNGNSVARLSFSSEAASGVDRDLFRKQPEELGHEDFFAKFSNDDLETVLESVQRLGETGVDESDPGNILAHEVFDILGAALKGRLAGDDNADDFASSSLARKVDDIFNGDFLGDLSKLRAKLINDRDLRNSATNLLAYLQRVVNYEAPDPDKAPF